jgi:hypothetical protein
MTTQTQNKRTQTSMPRVGFESMIPMLERAKTVHAFDRATTGIGKSEIILPLFSYIVMISGKYSKKKKVPGLTG